ncbi:MAG: hypothetical protein NZ480_09030, partial [Bdellovibrionaceae bacterium]|nr:hypothetical protein [Pseudobdellovibrionaceae bacterium]MDW8189387.1 hypothetical protein [Pseudobdellovibrionaceae bacterium]
MRLDYAFSPDRSYLTQNLQVLQYQRRFLSISYDSPTFQRYWIYFISFSSERLMGNTLDNHQFPSRSEW